MSFDQRETNDSHEVHCVEPQESVSAPRRMVRWFRDIWQDLVDTANPSTGSKHGEDLTPAELEKQASFESYDYYKAYPTMYIEHLRRTQRPASSSGSPGQDAPMSPTFSAAASHIQTYQANGDERRHIIVRWLLHILIALSVGVVAAVVAYAVDALESYRSVTLHHIINNASVRFGGCLVGFFFWVSASAAFVSIATAVVVFFEPAAAGGGIPDVMAYLNGVQLRRAMNIRTFLAKIVSCVFAVAGGLPVGLEAPLIHLGAITGAGVTQGRSRTLGFQTSLFSGFRNNKDRRDFITAGAACGVSAAFGAPIGGLLFVMEEVCSFWDHSASGQIFLATMVCFTFTSIINSAVEDRRLLGWVSNSVSVLFEVNVTIPLNLIAIVPSLFLGAMSGALAALFTKLNIILIKWRRVRLQPYPLRRVAEPVLIAVTYCGFMYLLTLVSECRHIEPIVDAANDTFHIWGTETEERLFDDLCFKSNAYSPFGSLSMLSGKTAIRHLFSRQTAGEFPWYYLLLFVVLYFIFACLSSGAAVSGGLVVPSLVLGAAFGRLFGLVLWTVGATHNPSIPHSYAATDSWMDPGVFALIGAGAFLAGTSRMTMSICVIMVELSAELHYLLPVMVAIVVSKTVADWLAEPLYHHMLHLTCVPYLPHDLERSEFEQLTAADVMASPVVTLRTKERTEVVLRALRNTSHHAFPVVEAVEGDDDDDVDVELEESRTRSRMCGQSAGTDLTAPATGLQRMKSTSSIGGGSTTRRRARRYKFVGLVTREDLQVYLSLPELRRPVVSSNASDVPKENPSVPPPSHPSPPTVQLLDQGMSWEDSDGFGGRLESCVMEVNRMNWKGWIRHKSSLFFGERQMVSNRPPALPRAPLSTVDVGRLNLSQGVDMDSIEAQLADLPQVVDLSLIINRSPWVVPPFFNLQMTYHTFRTMGLRHLVVVDGDTVSGIITRKDLLLDALRRRMRELWQRGEDDVMGVTIRSTSSTSVETDVRRGLRVSGNEQSIRSGLSPAESTIPLPGPSLLRRPASMPNAVNPLPHGEDGLLQTGSVTVDVVEPSAAQSCPP